MIIGLAFGLFVFVLAGSALSVVNFFRSRNLEERIRRLEEQGAGAQQVRRSGAERDPASSPPPGQDSAARPSREPETAHEPIASSPPSQGSRFDFEALVAGRWLNRIGILAVLLGTSFFLKYAFENDWIGPSGRVAIGLVAGTILIASSQWFLGRGLRYFSEGVAALGGGVLFLSLYAAWDFYELVPQAVAFGGMILVTASLAALAHGRTSQRLAVLALLAGLTTPGLLSTGIDRQSTLFVYLAILVATFLALAWRNSWRSLAPISLAGFALYFFSWYGEFYAPDKLAGTLAHAGAAFALFAMFSALRSRKGDSPRLEEIATVLANALWFGISLHIMLYDDHRWWLTFAVLALAAGHLGMARFAATVPWRYLFAGLALAFATAAVPIRLEGEWIRTTLAVEGAALVWAGFRGRVAALRAAGLVLFGVVTLLLFDASGNVDRFLLNERFLAFAALVVALGASAAWAGSYEGSIERRERFCYQAAGLVANAVAVWGLSEETWRLLGTADSGFDRGLARQLGLSLLWAACASLLIAAGVRKRRRALRWQGLLLIAVVVAKVFLFDLSFLESGYRIVSFIALGLVLLILSFFYQRGLSSQGDRESP